MNTQDVIEIIAAAWPILGVLGTAIENIGTITAKPSIVALGQKLEAIFLDFPKLLTGVK
jgi:hypothetical protein